MRDDKNVLRIVLKLEDGEELIANIEISDSKLIINDSLIKPILEKVRADKVKACEVNLGVHDIAVLIADYSITKSIYIAGFYDSPSYIPIFQVKGTNVHMVNQKVDLMQLDCQRLLIANSQIRQIDIGLNEHMNLLKSASSGNNIATAFKMEDIDIRGCEIKKVQGFIDCVNINIQGCDIDSFNLRGGQGSAVIAEIQRLFIWEYTNIKVFENYCKINKFRLKECSINNLVAKAHCYIDEIVVDDADIFDAHNFDTKHFKTMDGNAWSLVEISSLHDKNFYLKAEASYQISKLYYKNEKGINRLIGKGFDFCTGYGYKPMRSLIASLSIIMINALIYTIIDVVKDIISKNAQCVSSYFYSAYDNLLLSFAAFAGQSGLSMSDGVVFGVATLEYVIGIIIFAMFVNALYVRYKE